MVLRYINENGSWELIVVAFHMYIGLKFFIIKSYKYMIKINTQILPFKNLIFTENRWKDEAGNCIYNTTLGNSTESRTQAREEQ